MEILLPVYWNRLQVFGFFFFFFFWKKKILIKNESSQRL